MALELLGTTFGKLGQEPEAVLASFDPVPLAVASIGQRCGFPDVLCVDVAVATSNATGEAEHMSLAYWGMHDMGSGWWGVMVFAGLVFWGLVIWAVVFQMRGGDDRFTRSSAREILDRRLATGEISLDEYERLREALRPPSGPTAEHS